jgi:hypothetical protein
MFFAIGYTLQRKSDFQIVAVDHKSHSSLPSLGSHFQQKAPQFAHMMFDGHFGGLGMKSTSKVDLAFSAPSSFAIFFFIHPTLSATSVRNQPKKVWDFLRADGGQSWFFCFFVGLTIQPSSRKQETKFDPGRSQWGFSLPT